MKRLTDLVMVQFFLYEKEEMAVANHTAWLGPNGTGKTVLLDACQIALLGAHGTYIKLNSQKEGGLTRERTIAEYCLGALDSTHKREAATSWVALVFRDEKTGVPYSLGICIKASIADKRKHDVKGMFVASGIVVTTADLIEQTADGELPLEWADFQSEFMARCKREHADVKFHTTPERYIAEWLLALCGTKRPDVKAFLSAFQKSILLRNIDSVDGFVRDFLIDARRIDRSQAAQQIERFRTLQRLVEQTLDQIKSLETLTKDFQQTYRFRELAVNYEALGATLDWDERAERVDTLESELAALQAEYAQGAATKRQMQDEIDRLASEFGRINKALEASEPAQKKVRAESDLATMEQRLTDLGIPIFRVLDRIEAAMDRVEHEPALRGHQSTARAAKAHSSSARQALGKADVRQAQAHVGEALAGASTLLGAIEDLANMAANKHERAAEARRSMEAQIRSAAKLGVNLNPHTARAIERLEFECGIRAQPVCTLVKVSEPSWAAAIEAFLGNNREALIVPADRVDAAVAFLRSLVGPQRLYDAAIVQPTLLNPVVGRDQAPALVGSLLQSDSQVALSFLRNVLGGMVKAYSEEDLRKYPRALTQDGVVTATFKTRTLRQLSEAQLQFGKTFNPDDRAGMERELQRLRKAEEEAQGERDARLALRNAFNPLTPTSDVLKAWSQDVASLSAQLATIESQRALIASIDVGEFAELEQTRMRVEKLLRDATMGKDRYLQRFGGVENALTTKQQERDAAKTEFQRVRDKLEDAKSKAEYSAQEVETLRVALEEQKLGLDVAALIRECDGRARANADKFARKKDAAMDEFRTFITRHNIELIDERRDWHLARTFCGAELERLSNYCLGERQQEAEDARRLAEDNFRHGVAIHIYNAIEEMQRVIREKNRLLDACPEFNHSEKYRFEAILKENYRSFYNYIDAAATSSGDGASLLDDESSTSNMVMDMLMAPVGGSPTPLDDFRLMFAFDVQVLGPDGSVRTKLSKRVGTGSGGEYKVPFYLVAGSALAHAYQLDRDRDGVGVMLIDEAFNKVDSPNTLSAWRYLDGLGLQLLMTAPDDAFGKLIPITDRIYELHRMGDLMQWEASHIKDPARELMRSDMVQEHPDLLEAAMERIRSSQASE